MANLPETATYDAGVYQLETTDPVQGGVSGVSNSPLKNLANRTAYLKQRIDSIEAGTTDLPGYAKLASPAFTGSPTAPTQQLGDNSTKIANTAFVQGTVGGRLEKSVAGGANVTLTAVEAGNAILDLSGALTANIAVIVPTSPTRSWIVKNATSGAYTLTIKTAAGTGVIVTQGTTAVVWMDGTNVYDALTDFDSPALTGAPTAPTPAQFDNDTSVATTEFVQRALGNMRTLGSTNVSAAMTVSHMGGLYVYYGSTSGQTVTLPDATSFPTGVSVWFVNQSTNDVTIAGNGAAVISANNTGTGQTVGATLVVSAGDSIILSYNGGGQWNVHGYTSKKQFPSSLTPSGYQKLPSGLIIQWGVATAGTSGTVITFPIAFTTAVNAVATGIANNSATVLQTYSYGLTGFTFKGDGSQHSWVAIGY